MGGKLEQNGKLVWVLVTVLVLLMAGAIIVANNVQTKPAVQTKTTTPKPVAAPVHDPDFSANFKKAADDIASKQYDDAILTMKQVTGTAHNADTLYAANMNLAAAYMAKQQYSDAIAAYLAGQKASGKVAFADAFGLGNAYSAAYQQQITAKPPVKADDSLRTNAIASLNKALPLSTDAAISAQIRQQLTNLNNLAPKPQG